MIKKVIMSLISKIESSLVFKCIIRISMIGILMLVITYLAIPEVLHKAVKSKAETLVSATIQSCGIQLGRRWMFNTMVHNMLKKNEELFDLIQMDILSQEENKERVESINEALPSLHPEESRQGSQYTTGYDLILIINEVKIYSNSIVRNLAEAAFSSSEYKRYIKEEGKVKYFPFTVTQKDLTEKRYIGYVRTYYEHDMKVDSILIQDTEVVESVLLNTKDLGINDVAFLNYDNTFLFTVNGENQTKIRPEEFPDFIYEGKENDVEIYESKKGINFITLTSYKEEGLRLTFYVSYSELYAPYQGIVNIVLIIFATAFIFYAITIFISIKSSYKNLSVLSEKMKLVNKGDYRVRVDVSGKDEVATLADGFNGMMENINHNVNQIIQYKQNENKMQYKLLVSQIDPHFIYNTLNTITYMSKLGRNNDVIEINRALISILRDRLKPKEYDSFTTVLREKEKLKDYMQIQKYLCDNKIMLHFSVSEDLYDIKIPQNILQPLVENAIFHGILLHKNEDGSIIGGNISISIKKIDDKIQILVTDDGVGFSEDNIQKYLVSDYIELQETENHIGIKNIRMRLNYLYKKDFQVIARMNKSGGAEIEIIIPIQGLP